MCNKIIVYNKQNKMKKTNIPKTDRNTNIDNYFTSSMLPYQRTFEQQSSLKIIELDNSNTSDSDEFGSNFDQKHAWCYVDNDRLQTHSEYQYKINTRARARRRMTNKVCPEVVNKTIDYLKYENIDLTQSEDTNNNENVLCNKITTERTLPNNPLNCFTIINNELVDSDQSLTGTEEGMKIIQCGDVVLEDDYQKSNMYSTEKATYNRNIDNKRTIWIYSFKNKNLLTGDDMSENVSTEDSTSSSSIENFRNNTDYRERIATPIPSFIPRLNFYVAATLPPVTEVTEPLHITTPNNPHIEAKAIVPKFYTTNRLTQQTSPTLHCTVPSQNIINWMALSPRERRRKLQTPPNLAEDILENKCYELKHIALDKQKTNNFPLGMDEDSTIPNGNDVVDNEIVSGKTNSDLLDNITIDEKGDHNKIRHLKKPQILLKNISLNKITNPFENLNGDGWIGHENEAKDEETIDEKDINEKNEKPENIIRCAGDRLLNNNMTLLKPVQWAQYLPITESMPSLHLSLPSDINEDKKSWFKYIIKYFQCCKMCK